MTDFMQYVFTFDDVAVMVTQVRFDCTDMLTDVVEPEKMTNATQIQVYTRRWLPSELKIDPLKEVILEKQTVTNLKEKVSRIHGNISSINHGVRHRANNAGSSRHVWTQFVSEIQV